MKSSRNLLLSLASLVFIIMVGGATYEHIAVVPNWSSGPPASLSIFQGPHGLHAEYFWMAIHPIAILLLVISLVLNWRTLRKKAIIAVLGGYVLILIITSIYFVPELIAIIHSPYQDTVDQALLERASLWETLSLVRLIFLLILSMMLLGSLTIPDQDIIAQKTGEVPMSYQNDALGG